VKIRAYGKDSDPATRSARATLAITLSVVQRLFAPVLPFVTDEVWHWWHEGSVHVAPWPTLQELPVRGDAEPGSVYQPLCEVLEAVRREKSTQKVSQRAEVSLVTLCAPPTFLAAVRAGESDLMAAGGVRRLSVSDSDDFTVEVTLAGD
jgi:valyl-tRNA synthetase